MPSILMHASTHDISERITICGRTGPFFLSARQAQFSTVMKLWLDVITACGKNHWA